MKYGGGSVKSTGTGLMLFKTLIVVQVPRKTPSPNNERQIGDRFKINQVLQ